MSDGIEILGYREYIYVEDGPKWKNNYNGRGDLALSIPVDSVVLYSSDYGNACEYIRTTRLWKSPAFGTTHTVFQFSRVVIWNTKGACSSRKKCGCKKREN